MHWPFVSRSRFDGAVARVEELKGEVAELRESRDRILDEINYRSTGFHLFERFEKPEEPIVTNPKPKADALNDAPAEEPVFGTRIRAHLRAEEGRRMQKFQKEQEEQRQIVESKVAAVADQMEEVLRTA